MEESNNKEEVSLRDLLLKLKEWYHYLLSKWAIILIAAIIGGGLGSIYAYLKKPVYTAACRFVLEEGESSGALGPYAGLASMVGVDLGAGASGVFQGDNIIELYRSRKMICQALLSKDTFNNKEQLLIDRYIEFNKLRQSWQKNERIANINFSIPVRQYTLQHDSLISTFVEDIKKNYLSVGKPDKKLSILEVEVKSEDEQFAKAFGEKIMSKVNDFYVQTKTKKSAENLAILQHQADSVRAILNNSITGVAAAMDANPNTNPAFQRLRAPSQRKQVDVQANGAIYEEVVKNLEMAKITVRKDKPLIQVIDEPVLPLKIEKVGRLKGAAVGGLCVVFLVVIFLVAKRVLKGIISTSL